jgi:hypothetical protein
VRRAGKAKLISSKLAFKGKVFNVYTDTLIEPGGHRNTCATSSGTTARW